MTEAMDDNVNRPLYNSANATNDESMWLDVELTNVFLIVYDSMHLIMFFSCLCLSRKSVWPCV